MAKLSDGSLLVAVSQGANFFSSTGELLRFVDTDQDGVADGGGTVLYTNLPGSQSAVRVAGNLVFVTGQTKPITVLRAGSSPGAPLTLVGGSSLNIPALGITPTPRWVCARRPVRPTAMICSFNWVRRTILPRRPTRPP